LKKILEGKVIVGHSLQEDFVALKLNDQEYQCEVREISEFKIFKRPCFAYKRTSEFSSKRMSTYEDEVIGYEKRKLKELGREFLNASIQDSHHSSIIDARIALALYRTFQ